MKPFLALIFIAVTVGTRAAESDDFISLFNGRDLSGWVNVNCAPETWSVGDGVIHCTGLPTGALRFNRQYENFILELEWRHLSSGGNSGVFIWASPIAAQGVPFLRAIEVQVLDHGYNAKGKNEWYTTHGDVFPIHGSTMKPFGRHNGMRSFPSEERSNGSPEWNHYRVVCTNGVLRLSVNGKEVSGGEECNYRKGFIGLESEGAPADFRNIRIKELPPSGATPEMTAAPDLKWQNLFTGLDLRGWKTNDATSSHWTVSGEHLRLSAGPAGEENILWTEKQFGDVEFVVDCHPANSVAGKQVAIPSVQIRQTEVKLEGAKPDRYMRFLITVKGREVIVKHDGEETLRFTLPANSPARSAFGLRPTGGASDFMNLYARDL